MQTEPAAVPAAIDDPDRWADSIRRARRRRAAEARAQFKRALKRHGIAVGIGAFALAGGGAMAHQTAKPRVPAAITVLNTGARGDAVAALQSRLGIPADGIYGPQTRRAVRRFQRRNALVVDGIAGPVTLSKLGISSAPAAPSGDASLLARIAECESGGDPTAVSSDGRYRGKYQFSRATWQRLGGEGDPAAAPEAEQDRLAAKLLAAEGTAPWPTCARY